MKLEPVDITFQLNNEELAKDAKAVEVSLGGIGKASVASADQVRTSIDEQRQIIKGIEADIKAAEKALKTMAPGKGQLLQAEEVASAKKALQEQVAILNELENQTKSTVAQQKSLRTELYQIREAMSALSRAGKENTEDYRALEAELGRLTDVYKDVQTQAKVMANDERAFQGVIEGIGGVAGAFSAAQGAIGLFAGENEQLEKIMLRVQSAMAITIGLQQVAQALNKDSAFMLVTVRKAKEAWVITEKALTTALWGSNVAAKALMGTLTLGLAVAIPIIISLIDKWRDAEKKKADEAKKLAEKQAEVQKEINEGYGKEQSKIEALRASLNSDNVSRKEKLAIIKNLKEAIPSYTAELDKEGNVIRENTKAVDEYMQALEKSLKFRAAEKELEGLYSRQYALENKYKNAVEIWKNFSQGAEGEDERAGAARRKLLAQYSSQYFTFKTQNAEIQKQIEERKKYITESGLIENPNTGKSSTAQEYDAHAALQEQLINIRTKTAALSTQIQEDSLKKRLQLLDQEQQQEMDKVIATSNKIIDQWNKTYNKDEAKLQPGASKEDVSKALTGIDMPQAKATLAALTEQQKQYTANREKLEADAAIAIEEIQKNLTSQLADEQTRQLADVKNKYDKIRQETAKQYKDGKIPNALGTDITNAEIKERERVLMDFNFKQLDLVNELNDSKIEIETQGMFASFDIEEKKLRNLIRVNEKKIAALQATGKAEDQIQAKILANQNKAYGTQADATSLGKAQAVLSTANQITSKISSSFSGLNSNLSQFLKGFSTITDNLAGVVSSYNSGDTNSISKITSIISLLTTLISWFYEIDSNQDEKRYARDRELNEASVKSINDFSAASVEAINKLTTAIDRFKGEEVLTKYVEAIQQSSAVTDGALFRNNYVYDQTKQTVTAYATDPRLDRTSPQIQAYIANLESALNPANGYIGPRLSSQTQVGTNDIEKIELKYQNITENLKIIEDYRKTAGGRISESVNASLQAYEDGADQFLELRLTYYEQLLGTTSDDLAGGLTSALRTAFEQGEDMQLAFANNFEDAMRDAMINALQIKYIDAQMDDFYNSFVNSFSDLSLTEEEQLALRSEYKEIWDKAQAALAAMEDVSGIDFAEGSGAGTKSTGISGGFKAMSQDTADVLTGQFTAIRQHTTFIPDISNDMKSQLSTMARQLVVQYEIRDNIIGTNNRIDSLIGSFEDMKRTGLLIK